MSMSLRVDDAPVARTTDPITSYLAGENPTAREASEREVYAILAMNAPDAMTDHAIWQSHDEASLMMRELSYTPQRLRTARAQLVAKGLVEAAGVRPGVSPTGRSAQTWALVTS